ncbi:MAG: metal ABC transporter ATP-binding protein [Bacilli bacterium]|nr:metal ABC transporter ATP-binding protein [Bacilli bacterium]MDD4076422.1 metal ABC transporter ATP-binding protein [Bacilli bacterium]MDD4387778.1 metal ABC transporter ATP-binding protein [Bacilli bacterium]
MRISVNNLTFAYTQRPVLKNISFNLSSGNFLSVVGKNGTGKSTLIKCLLKIVAVPNNTIFFDDIDINAMKRFYHVGYVPQKLDFAYEFPITVSEFLSCAYLKRKDAFFTALINALDLNPIYRENINNLSGGQLQRVFIARSLLNKPKILILDEPTVSIDNESVAALHNILKDLHSNNVTIILSTHDFDFAKNLTDYYLALNEKGEYQFLPRKDYDNVIEYI